jgi:hypothetical protein
MRRAVAQLNSIENDLRRRLARIAPGDPEGIVDVDVVRRRLQERNARLEMGVPTNLEVPVSLEMTITSSNEKAVRGLAVISAVWALIAISVLAVMLARLVESTFGLISLIASTVLWINFSAFMLEKGAVSESISLSGQQLTLRRRILGFEMRKVYTLPFREMATVGPSRYPNLDAESPPPMRVLLHDIGGHQIELGASASPTRQAQVCEQINQYLRSQAESEP